MEKQLEKSLPLSRKPPKSKNKSFIVGSLDCETKGLGGKITFVTYTHEKTFEVGSKFNMKQFLDVILNNYDRNFLRNIIWYSHNGEYDWMYLIDGFRSYIKQYDMEAYERAHGVLYQLVIREKPEKDNEKGKVVARFRDSLALFKGTLLEFSGTFVPEAPKGSINFDEEDFDRRNPVHVEYAKNDASCLMKSLVRYDEFIHRHFGVHLQATAAGTAYQALLRTLPGGTCQWRLYKQAEDLIRKTYHGGMVQINAYHREPYYDVDSYDINSTYPAVMRLGVPGGKPFWTSRYEKDQPGFYKIRFTVADDFILPVLGYKDNKGLSFPTGKNIETWATSIEIDYARSLGYEIDTFDGYFFPDGLIYPFNNFVQKCEDLRKKYKGKPLEFVIKLMQNSIYGRFAMGEEGRELRISYEDITSIGSGEFGKGGWEPVCRPDNSEIPDLYARPVIRSTEYMLPHWASWITANARILLDNGCREVGVERVLYRDTDSLFLQGEALGLNIGVSYGYFKAEKHFRELRIHAPKFYSFENDDGSLGCTCKGIPRRELDAEAIDDLHHGIERIFQFTSVNGLLSYMRVGTKTVGRTRRQTLAENVTSHYLTVDGFFRPRRIDGQATASRHGSGQEGQTVSRTG